MPVNTSGESVLRSAPGKLFLARAWLPFLVAAGVVGVFWDSWRGIWIVSLLILVAVFHLTLAEVKAEPNALCYRRLAKWTSISYEQILGCGIAWDPFIGFLKLDRFVFPWGRLYFVLDGSLYENAFRQQARFELERYITDRVREIGSPQLVTTGQPQWGQRQLLKCLAAGFVGMLVSLLLALLLPPELTQFHPTEPDWPRWLVVYDQARRFVFGWPWNLAVFALLILVMAYRSSPRRAWVFAFMAGALLPSVLGWS